MVDASGTASTVFRMAGIGIGLGLLARTANHISRTSNKPYQRSRRSSSTCRQPKRRRR